MKNGVGPKTPANVTRPYSTQWVGSGHETTLSDNVQILVISKKLVNKLHSVGFITSLWLGVTQWITNEISNFVTCSNNIT